MKSREENFLKRIIKNIRKKETSEKLLIEPKPEKYDEGENTVVMKKSNLDNLKVNMDVINKKIKLENGFLSVYDLSDEELIEMIQLYNDEIKERKQSIAMKKLKIEKMQNAINQANKVIEENKDVFSSEETENKS
jgi:hypothetical protein